MGAMPVWIEATVGILATGTTLIGPAAAWWLHHRRPSWAALVGAVTGMLSVAAIVLSLALIGTAIGWLLSPVTTSELAGPIAMLVIVGTVFLAAVAATVGASVRSVRLRTFGRLAIARILGLGLLLAYAIGSWWYAIGSDDPERAEPIIFAITWGLAGMLIVLGADIASTWWQRRRSVASRRPG